MHFLCIGGFTLEVAPLPMNTASAGGFASCAFMQENARTWASFWHFTDVQFAERLLSADIIDLCQTVLEDLAGPNEHARNSRTGQGLTNRGSSALRSCRRPAIIAAEQSLRVFRLETRAADEPYVTMALHCGNPSHRPLRFEMPRVKPYLHADDLERDRAL
jgi:hypothetical protein